MPFLTQGKTNWKFLLIVVVLVAIVGGGILYYQYTPKECSSSADCEGKTNIILCVGEWKCVKGTCVWDCSQTVPPEDETADWQTYRNEEYGFEIKYLPGFAIKYPETKYPPESSLNFSIFASMENSLDNYLNFHLDKLSVMDMDTIEKSKKSFGDAKEGIFYTMHSLYYGNRLNAGFVFNKGSFTYHFWCYWCYLGREDNVDLFLKSLASIKFIDSFAQISMREVGEAKVYKNENYGIEFEYPKELDSLALQSIRKDLMGNEIYVFSVSGELISTLYYHKSTKTIAFIKKGEKCQNIHGDPDRQDVLQIYKDKEIKTIYSSKNCLLKIQDINISPDGRYVYFGMTGWEYFDSVMINIDSGLNIIDRYPIDFGSGYERAYDYDVYWSPNNKVLTIRSFGAGIGSPGIDGLFVSDYDNPEKLNQILSSFAGEEWRTDIYDIHFIGDHELFFTVSPTDCDYEEESKKLICKSWSENKATYKYNTITKDLEEVIE